MRILKKNLNTYENNIAKHEKPCFYSVLLTSSYSQGPDANLPSHPSHSWFGVHQPWKLAMASSLASAPEDHP